jgi:hypothetical protein
MVSNSKRLKKAAEAEGALLPLFVAPSQLKPYVSKELEDGPLKPKSFCERLLLRLRCGVDVRGGKRLHGRHTLADVTGDNADFRLDDGRRMV